MSEGKAASTDAEGKLQLDELMLAMDVVDTLRHRQQLVQRELDSGAREKDLVDRLRKIYGDQGIDVPEHILVEGIQTLDEHRFEYQPPEPSLSTRLARIYVSRSRWMRVIGIGLLVLAGLKAVHYFGWERRRLMDEQAIELQLTRALPHELESLRDRSLELAADGDVARSIRELYQDGLAAIERRDVRAANEAIEALEEAQGLLRSQYAVRIVARPGEVSGVWRIPDANPDARNFYLIVEAVNERGNVVPVFITSEEDQRTSRTGKWGLRVDEDVFDRVRADKEDDGIIQDRRVGQKSRGYLTHSYRIETDGGTILDW